MKKEFAVIFKTKRNLPMPPEYGEVSKKLTEFAKSQNGFLRIETVADNEGNGISVSYWNSLEAIAVWKTNTTHLYAQSMGKSAWYEDYSVEICEVTQRYSK
jgi:heme-degrading monooxygenase HmoA